MGNRRPTVATCKARDFGVHLSVPSGLGLSDEDIKLLIDAWVVPRLIKIFVSSISPADAGKEGTS
jgi:hypothetical protein